MPKIEVSPQQTAAPRLSGAARSGLASVKAGFFNRAKVMAAVEEGQRVALMRGGAIVRRVAQFSMRYRKSASQPGTPPSARSGSEGSLLRKFLFFAYDEPSRGVVVGPVKLGNRRSLPSLHEHGGVLSLVHREPKNVGESGPIRIVEEGFWDFGPATRFIKGDPRQRQVVYGKLTSAAQVERANRLQEEMYAHGDRRYPPRPYMRPALERSRERILKVWENVLGVKREKSA